jgi:hypothetical protein
VVIQTAPENEHRDPVHVYPRHPSQTTHQSRSVRRLPPPQGSCSTYNPPSTLLQVTPSSIPTLSMIPRSTCAAFYARMEAWWCLRLSTCFCHISTLVGRILLRQSDCRWPPVFDHPGVCVRETNKGKEEVGREKADAGKIGPPMDIHLDYYQALLLAPLPSSGSILWQCLPSFPTSQLPSSSTRFDLIHIHILHPRQR